MSLKYEDLAPADKAAVAVLAMGDELASEILKALPQVEAKRLTTAIANLREIPSDTEERVLTECYQMLQARDCLLQGDIDCTRNPRERAAGELQSAQVLSHPDKAQGGRGFRKLHNIDSRQLVSFLQSEHPQTVALILTQLKPQLAAAVLSELLSELQSDVALRVATMERISPDVLNQLESVLDGQFDTGAGSEVAVFGGAGQIAEILNLVDRTTEKQILQSVESREPELALQIRNLMFAFEDIARLDDRSIQNLLKEIGTSDLAIALKTASDELQRTIFSNLSERVSAMIREEMEFMGPMRLSEVEVCQRSIIETVRRLEDDGQVFVSGRGNTEHVVV